MDRGGSGSSFGGFGDESTFGQLGTDAGGSALKSQGQTMGGSDDPCSCDDVRSFVVIVVVGVVVTPK